MAGAGTTRLWFLSRLSWVVGGQAQRADRGAGAAADADGINGIQEKPVATNMWLEKLVVSAADFAEALAEIPPDVLDRIKFKLPQIALVRLELELLQPTVNAAAVSLKSKVVRRKRITI